MHWWKDIDIQFLSVLHFLKGTDPLAQLPWRGLFSVCSVLSVPQGCYPLAQPTWRRTFFQFVQFFSLFSSPPSELKKLKKTTEKTKHIHCFQFFFSVLSVPQGCYPLAQPLEEDFLFTFVSYFNFVCCFSVVCFFNLFSFSSSPIRIQTTENKLKNI